MKKHVKHFKINIPFQFHKIKTIILCALIMTLLCNGCSLPFASREPYTKSVIAFDTISTISIYDQISKDQADVLLTNCVEKCNTYENLFSRTKAGSDVYRINHSNGQPTEVHKETIDLIKEAIRYCKATNGLVDITIAPLKELWDFSNPDDQASADLIPSSDAIASVLPYIDYEQIIIDENNNTVTLADANAGIDLGFIAKGYIADKLAEYLKSESINHALINLGGNVYAIGQKTDQTDFTVGIQKPFDTNTYLTTLTIHDTSVVTSGVYERYFKVDGMLYHHVLNPKTGYPADTDLYSVTIICDSSTMADALSTSCLLLGSKKAKEFLKSYEGVTAYFVYSDMTMEYVE